MKSLTTTYLKQSIELKNLRRTHFFSKLCQLCIYWMLQLYKVANFLRNNQNKDSSFKQRDSFWVFALPFLEEIALANSLVKYHLLVGILLDFYLRSILFFMHFPVFFGLFNLRNLESVSNAKSTKSTLKENMYQLAYLIETVATQTLICWSLILLSRFGWCISYANNKN